MHRLKSCAQWPAGTFDSQGNHTEDTHDTRGAAEAVCSLLHKNGAGGDGLAFPVKTWVEEIKPDSAKTEAELEREIHNPDVSDLAYVRQRQKAHGVVVVGSRPMSPGLSSIMMAAAALGGLGSIPIHVPTPSPEPERNKEVDDFYIQRAEAKRARKAAKKGKR